MEFTPERQDAKLRHREHEDRLGEDIVDECRVQLMLRFRFLDRALWRMDLRPLRVGARYPLATDARQVFYDPPRVIARFRESFEESVRDCLHLIMHCIFRHPHNQEHDNREAWGLACDIVVESAAMDLCGDRFASADDPARRQALSEMRMIVGRLLPNKVYSLIDQMASMPEGQRCHGLGRNALNEWRNLFERDDHGAWPANAGMAGQEDGPERDADEGFSEDDVNPEASSDGLRVESAGEDEPGEAQAQRDAREEKEGDEAGSGGDSDESAVEEGGNPQVESPDGGEAEGRDQSGILDEDAERERRREEAEWRDIAKQIEMNLETFSREWGEEAGSLMANLTVANRSPQRYEDFLRQFMTVTEEMRLDMEQFDYVYYIYGMDRYGNMPLIEPLEYRETERVRDFVIVIDTSESVRGDLVKRFVEHTFDLLKSSETYASEVNIHLVQCDAKVQSDTVIGDLGEVDRLMEGFRICGFGGTDFRPAFDYVDTLRRRGQLPTMKGLIYFTDGLGQFPDKPPDYDVAFVFVDEEGGKLPPVPPWACRIVIDEAGIKQRGSRAGNRSATVGREG